MGYSRAKEKSRVVDTLSLGKLVEFSKSIAHERIVGVNPGK